MNAPAELDLLAEIDRLRAKLARYENPRGRGGISSDRARVLADRNALLLRLAAGHAEWADLPPSAAARFMRLSFARYETTRWPRERHALSVPHTEPAATWWRILRSGAPMPGAERLRQLFDAAKFNRPFGFGGRQLKTILDNRNET